MNSRKLLRRLRLLWWNPVSHLISPPSSYLHSSFLLPPTSHSLFSSSFILHNFLAFKFSFLPIMIQIDYFSYLNADDSNSEAISCPNNCTIQGDCIKGLCNCFSSWYGPLCDSGKWSCLLSAILLVSYLPLPAYPPSAHGLICCILSLPLACAEAFAISINATEGVQMAFFTDLKHGNESNRDSGIHKIKSHTSRCLPSVLLSSFFCSVSFVKKFYYIWMIWFISDIRHSYSISFLEILELSETGTAVKNLTLNTSSFMFSQVSQTQDFILYQAQQALSSLQQQQQQSQGARKQSDQMKGDTDLSNATLEISLYSYRNRSDLFFANQVTKAFSSICSLNILFLKCNNNTYPSLWPHT